MNLKMSAPVIIAIVFIALVIGGELIISASTHDDFSSDIKVEGESIIVDVDAHGSHQVDAISMNGSYSRPDMVYIYYDDSYESEYDDVQVAVGARPLSQTYYVKMIMESLKVRDINNVKLADAKEIADVVGSSGKDIAIVFASGALPDTVYDGTSDSKILKWIESGGRLYWIGNIIGKYISHQGSVESVENGTTLFMGSECIDDAVVDSFDKYLDNGLTESLSIINHRTRCSVIVDQLPIGTKYNAFGYTDGDRYSTIVVEKGDGCIAILGGDYTDYQRIDLAQILASGISPYTQIVDSYEGSAHGKVSLTLKSGSTVYVYLGGDLVVYGKLQEAS